MMIKFWQTMQKKEVIALLFKNFLLIVVVVQLLSHVQLFATPWTAAHQAILSFTVSQFAQIHVHSVIDTI